MQSAEPAAARGTKSIWRLHRNMYDWVLRWADRPQASWALFLLAFAESSFFPIPPDVLLMALVIGARGRWWRLAAICTAGSVLGGLAGYGIGAGLMEALGHPIIRLYHAEASYERVRDLYVQYDYWVVFTAAFTPIPYKVFTIASGAMDMNLAGFAGVSLVGRGARFFLVAGLLWLCGPSLRRFIERYFDLLTLVFLALLAGGFLIIKWMA